MQIPSLGTKDSYNIDMVSVTLSFSDKNCIGRKDILCMCPTKDSYSFTLLILRHLETQYKDTFPNRKTQPSDTEFECILKYEP